jgi:hypothetical protein
MIGTALRSRAAPLDVGQPEVEEHDVVRYAALLRVTARVPVGLGDGQRLASRRYPLHGEAVPQQATPERLGHRLVVFNQEYAHG